MNGEPIDNCPQCGRRMRVTKTGRPTVHPGGATVRDKTRFCRCCNIIVRCQSVENVVKIKKMDTCVQTPEVF